MFMYFSIIFEICSGLVMYMWRAYWEEPFRRNKGILMLFICLRFQEIAGALDSALMVGSVVPSKSSHSEVKESEDLVLSQSISLLECMRSCWRDDVLVLSCSDKFLRLTLQLLSRLACYKKWVQFFAWNFSFY